LSSNVLRIFVEKKNGFDVEARKLDDDIINTLNISTLKGLRIINRYDIEGIAPDEFEASKYTIFSESTVDAVYIEKIAFSPNEKVISIEYLPGQYDQRADSAAQCVQILTCGELPVVKTAKLIVLKGDIPEDDYTKIKNYCINPLECREALPDKPETLTAEVEVPENISVLRGFTALTEAGLKEFMDEHGLAMSIEDLKFCQEYFKNTEKRDPAITEIRVIDTYWSDHCRHTTFQTVLKDIEFEEGPYAKTLRESYENYLASQLSVNNANKNPDISLMNIATVAMKALKEQGLLLDQEVSEENNACSIVVKVNTDKGPEDWLVMFKNETHNHPTEIEPLGGAATCLGGAIRDPLSGRAFVYQAMRVTGSADPRTSIENTLPGKLPQKKITTGAAAGYSSYGNQIGLATGQVSEVYHDNFVAKRMEIGAVIAAAPLKNVKRETPAVGDVIILLGGKTGRDGCGGATGSSKAHTVKSLAACGSEVQKGNPPTERKIQRLFRHPEASRMIIRCNDFGAGGVSVAIGELADGIEIFLDRVPKKYEGLDGTELAISESQERMAVVVSKRDEETFMHMAGEENLEATTVAYVTDDERMKMYWRGIVVVDISREFLNTNGIKQYMNVRVTSPKKGNSYLNTLPKGVSDRLGCLKDAWLVNLSNLNNCSKRGLVEMFDSTIGAGTVLMPLGGKYQLSPQEGMAAKIPVPEGSTTTGTLMSYGYNPDIGCWSPFHGAIFAILESCAKIVAMGGNYKNIRLTMQEYFEKLGNDPEKWGKPLAALLGAYLAQMHLKIPAIGGKDSMSGTFMDISVPPTLVSFAVNVVDDVGKIVSAEFKGYDNWVVLLELPLDENEIPDFHQLDKNYSTIYNLIQQDKILSARSIRAGGIAAAVSEMALGNMIGFDLKYDPQPAELFKPVYGSILLEISKKYEINNLFDGLPYTIIGTTEKELAINVGSVAIPLADIRLEWEKPLEKVFPTKVSGLKNSTPKDGLQYGKNNKTAAGSKSHLSCAKPRIFIPVFPGTNCEYDTAKAFTAAGGIVDTLVIRNLSSTEIKESLEIMAEKISNAQIIALPGGFSAGDEPEGSGKFIEAIFRNSQVANAVMKLLKQRDGLMLGICNGFQALIKLGLVPFGEIRPIDESCPTLTFNLIGRHVSKLVNTKVTSRLSPWLNNVELGDTHLLPVSHGEGRFIASEKMLEDIFAKGQVATQYVDFDGNPTYDMDFNPNGSMDAIEGITSPDGRVFGKMAHSERISNHTAINVPGNKDQKLFKAGVKYFQ